MQNTFSLYEPLGPLCYLLMDSEGKMQLGLYNLKQSKRLVLILKVSDDFFVLNPNERLMEGFFRDEKMLLDLVCGPNGPIITDIENNQVSESTAWRVIDHVKHFFPGFLSQQKHFMAYPNYYYLYQAWMGKYNN